MNDDIADELLEWDYGFDKFMDDIVEREEKLKEQKLEKAKQMDEKPWGLKRAHRSSEHPLGRIKFG